MGKRKLYIRTQMHSERATPSEARYKSEEFEFNCRFIPPAIRHVDCGINTTSYRKLDFSPWYDVGIDSITYAFQNQIERFLTSHDSFIEVATVVNYWRNGVTKFLEFLLIRKKFSINDLTLSHIDRKLMDEFLAHLARKTESKSYQRGIYVALKGVLTALGQRGIITLIPAGDEATFPPNPFPHHNKKVSGETALPKAQRQAFTSAVKHAALPIWDADEPLTCDLLCYALLIIALHTGRNTTALFEMGRDCLRSHPKENTKFLVLWKRRGHNTNKVALRGNSEDKQAMESTPSVRANIEQLILQVIAKTEELIPEAPDHLKTRVWIYRVRGGKDSGKISTPTGSAMMRACQKLVADYDLTDVDGQPLRINISRLRKTFGNRIYELTGGDLTTTAIALGNTPQVAGRNYLAPNEDSKRNWLFMGKLLVQELLSGSIGTTYKKTPTGRCSDPINGQYAPKTAGATCTNFLNCLRCKHYAVTAEDLYKLFSFYFRVFAERSHMDKRRWTKEYAHIPRLIDNYIVAEGLKRGIFKKSQVESARERAKSKPHPFWSYDAALAILT
ncbi:hypothetical protein ACIP1G_18955 [Pseudomonas sp. NPDC089392]|uniref:hypothetical protein n=1 Tax=Pseudomonas sp. NPDC089392 TaxID=3364459 RepID=UPI003812FDCF